MNRLVFIFLRKDSNAVILELPSCCHNKEKKKREEKYSDCWDSNLRPFCLQTGMLALHNCRATTSTPLVSDMISVNKGTVKRKSVCSFVL